MTEATIFEPMDVAASAVSSAAKKEYWIEPVDESGKPIYLALKRVFDIVASLTAMLVFAVPMVLIALLIRLESPGASLYVQERLGKNGKVFLMYKFRSMRMDAEKEGPRWAEKEDSRTTRFGKFLRRTRLDELPQMWNVLRGDMSLVGPRPERQCFYELFETYVHGFNYRLTVQPGLTGWAQVNGGYDLMPEEKIVYDMEYIRSQSLKMDLLCIIRTVKLLFTHEGAR